MSEAGHMKGASAISWIDRQYADQSAKYAFLLVAFSPWLIVLLLDKHVVATVLATVWSTFWTGLFLWRARAWLQRLDKQWRRRRR